MVELPRLEQSLLRIIVGIETYLPSVVLIGGWVPHLYKRFGGILNWDGPLSLTSELDVLVPTELPPSGRRTLPEVLKDAEFEPVGDAGPYAVWANDPDVGEKVEFLVSNPGTARQEGTVLPVQSQPDLGAIALDALSIMARHTDTIVVPREAFQAAGVPCDSDITCVVPTLGAYTSTRVRRSSNVRPLRLGTIASDTRIFSTFGISWPEGPTSLAISERMSRTSCVPTEGRNSLWERLGTPWHSPYRKRAGRTSEKQARCWLKKGRNHRPLPKRTWRAISPISRRCSTIYSDIVLRLKGGVNPIQVMMEYETGHLPMFWRMMRQDGGQPPAKTAQKQVWKTG
jgi:hypothetical protein